MRSTTAPTPASASVPTRRPASLRRRAASVLATLAATAGLLSTGTAPASAINFVDPFTCNFSFDDYFRVHFQNSASGGTVYQLCLANAGEMNINQRYTVRVDSGNNAGWFVYAPGDGYEYRHTFPKFENIARQWGTVYEVHIN
ncbi:MULTISPECIES: hypothetical protein [unclassified Streptomyces]|uniref:hypothetical protein n=1 Tax=unclassified Streptomyces TaxID=2593676 RepID=UPI0036E68CA3